MLKTCECSFSKNILTAGDGFSCPSVESKCHVTVKEISNCIGNSLTDDFKNIILEIKELTVGWPVNGAMKVIEDLVVTMKTGEISQFQVSMNSHLIQDYTSKTDLSNTESKCSLILELVSFDDAIPLWKLSDSEKYDSALRHKNEGSKLFQDGNVLAAFFHYRLSMRLLTLSSISGEQIKLDGDDDDDDDDDEERRKLICICHLNLAACQLKYKNYDSVVMNCSKALNIDGRNVKALFRRACAFKALGRNSDARSDLLSARRHEPRSKVIHDLLQSLPPDGGGVKGPL